MVSRKGGFFRVLWEGQSSLNRTVCNESFEYKGVYVCFLQTSYCTPCRFLFLSSQDPVFLCLVVFDGSCT